MDGSRIEYGSRPVSIDLLRHQPLHAVSGQGQAWRVRRAPVSATRDCVDRLAVKHWPQRHRILVCSLAGGVGRSTVARAIADLLAELPYAKIWAPILLIEAEPRRWVRMGGDAAHAQASPEPGRPCCQPVTEFGREPVILPSGAHALPLSKASRPATVDQTEAALASCEHTHRVSVLDTPTGLPCDHPWINDASYSVLLVTRPDRGSLDEAADALTWMNDNEMVPRSRVTVAINSLSGPSSRVSYAAGIALAVRCRGVHRIARLTPDTVRTRRTRERLAGICLDLWASSQRSTANPILKEQP